MAVLKSLPAYLSNNSRCLVDLLICIFAACACTSTNSWLTAAKVLAVTDTPLLVALLLPSLVTERVMINSPSSTMTPHSSNTLVLDNGTVKRPLAINRSLPFRTKALSLLPPKIKLRAVKIMVFPAPVSPERTVSPFEISSVA